MFWQFSDNANLCYTYFLIRERYTGKLAFRKWNSTKVIPFEVTDWAFHAYF